MMGLNKVQQMLLNIMVVDLFLLRQELGNFYIINKIEYLLELKFYIPEEILCLTFTNQGCNEMIDKIKKNLMMMLRE